MNDTQRQPNNAPRRGRWGAAVMFTVRYGLGGAMILAGIIVLVAVEGDLGAYGFASAVGAGLSILLLNLLYRLSVSGDRDREQEAAARRYFDAHGTWPDDDAPTGAGRKWTLPQGTVTAEQEERAGAREAPTGVLEPR